MVECITLFGERKMVPRASLVFRPSVYAVVVRGDALLVAVSNRTGKYSFPGGGVELGERMDEALRRELREEAGLDLTIGDFIDRREVFFFHDPTSEAWHVLAFFFAGTVLTGEVRGTDADEYVRWVPIRELRAEQFTESYAPVAQNVLDGMSRS